MNSIQLRRTRRLLAHFDAAYLLAVRMTRTSQDAEDVVQESLFKAARSPHLIPASDDDDGLRKWLLKVVANTARNHSVTCAGTGPAAGGGFVFLGGFRCDMCPPSVTPAEDA